MDRELLIEIGCEEIPASWLPPLTEQWRRQLEAQLAAARLPFDGPAEAFSTPRRLMACVAKVADHQTDLEETVTGPPVSAAFGPDGQPTPAAAGFARRQGVGVEALERIETPRGAYLAYQRRQRGRAAADVLSDVLAALLRALDFPKQMHWDAWLDDGRGELLFGRPIRWLLFLYGGRVIPFVIQRAPGAQSPLVQDVRSGAVTYGHRFLALSGRPGRSIKVRTVKDYQARLAEHFVVLDRSERRDRIRRELETRASRLDGRVFAGTAQSALLEEVVDLVEYPAVVAGTFAAEFLELPPEVLTTTMIRHQHYFPVVDEGRRLKPAFLAVTNTQAANEGAIARNSERVLAARLRDARFFWQADRAVPLEDRLERLETILFHKSLGTYRAKADRIERLAAWMAEDVFGRPDAAAAAGLAGRLAKADLATDMVREFTELQGVMGGIYAREGGAPAPVWKAIYYHYLPVGVEADAPPSRDDLGEGALAWAAVSLADKLDTLVGMFHAGERPTGSRDPFGLRRAAQGIVKILLDLPEVTGVDRTPSLGTLVRKVVADFPGGADPADAQAARLSFWLDRLDYVLRQRGVSDEAVRAVLHRRHEDLSPLDLLRRAQAVDRIRAEPEFVDLARLYKRVTNIVPADVGGTGSGTTGLGLLQEASERDLWQALERIRPEVAGRVGQGDYVTALRISAGLAPLVDRFFTDVLVMVEDAPLRHARLSLLAALRDLVWDIADISYCAPQAAA